MKKVLFILLILILGSIILGGCDSKESTISPTNALPEQVVRDYFKYWNDKNVSKMEELMTSNNKGISWELEKLKYVKLISINESKSHQPNNQKTFNVEFEIKFKDGSGSGLSDGKVFWPYVLRMDTEKSRWLIYGWGV